MKIGVSLIVALALVLAFPSSAVAKDKKKHEQRGMLESMQSVPCGVKQGGVNGLGSIFGSVGIEHINSNEKLCAQYLLRTDEMDYHIRPMDSKHAVLLPVGHEGEFKIKKDKLYLKVPDEDKKTREYQVISMQPVSAANGVESSSYRAVEKPPDSRSASTDKPYQQPAQQVTDRPPQK
jgi:hypothetical protein